MVDIFQLKTGYCKNVLFFRKDFPKNFMGFGMNSQNESYLQGRKRVGSFMAHVTLGWYGSWVRPSPRTPWTNHIGMIQTRSRTQSFKTYENSSWNIFLHKIRPGVPINGTVLRQGTSRKITHIIQITSLQFMWLHQNNLLLSQVQSIFVSWTVLDFIIILKSLHI